MSNMRAREALERAQRLFLERPSAGKKPNASATAVWRHGLQCEISGPGGERATTDMPAPMGGDGSGPNPGWLLRAAMASCAATALAMRAAMLGIELRELEVKVHSESDIRGAVGIAGVSLALSDMRMSIKVGADNVPESQLRELAQWAATESAVCRTLRDAPPVAFEVCVA